MYYQNLTKLYPVSKTIRNELIPIGRTLENIKKNNILEKDVQRKADYERVKALMDAYHRQLINESLQKVHLSNLEVAAELYLKNNGNAAEFGKCQGKLRKEIVGYLKKHENFSIIRSKNIIKLLQKLSDNAEDVAALESFANFYSYFTSYNEVRKNLYSDKEKASTVPYRLINENLPKFLDNIKAYSIAKKAGIYVEGMTEEEQDSLFVVDTFNRILNQDGIDNYNSAIGQVNIAINLYNQQNKKLKEFRKIPKLKELYKQILSDRETVFVDEFCDDDDMLAKLEAFSADITKLLNGDAVSRFTESLKESNGKQVYIKNDVSKTAFSNIVFGSWNVIDERLADDYDAANPKKKKDEKYYEKRKKELKKNPSYTIERIIEIYSENVDVIGKYIERLQSDINQIEKTKNNFEDIVLKKHDRNKLLAKNAGAVEAIKAYLDSIKVFEHDIKLIKGSGQELEKNLSVYAELDNVLSEIRMVDTIYNMARNYLTKKPFSTEKFKLNFNNPTLLNGWDINKEKDYLGVLFEKEGKIYLGIIDNDYKKIFEGDNHYTGKGECFNKIVYKQISDAARYLSSKQINPQKPPKEISDILRKRKDDSSSLSQKEIEHFIDYLKDDFLVNYPMIIDDAGENYFDFHFKEANEYETLQSFFKDVERQAYAIRTTLIDASYIYQIVDEGKLYLFQIYNKDFSPYSKGNLNLHTIYLSMLFDERNLRNVVYKLNGEAEVFYRPASIEDDELIVHSSGDEIKNKNPKRAKNKPTSKFDYDIVKDRRYSKDKFLLHIPVTMNFGVDETRWFNDVVNDILRADDKVRVIGIDRGERNLLYVVVVWSYVNK